MPEMFHPQPESSEESARSPAQKISELVARLGTSFKEAAVPADMRQGKSQRLAATWELQGARLALRQLQESGEDVEAAVAALQERRESGLDGPEAPVIAKALEILKNASA